MLSVTENTDASYHPVIVDPRMQMVESRGWRDGSVLKSKCFTSRGLRFCPSHPHWLIDSVMPAPEDSMPSSGVHRHPHTCAQAHMYT